jgi:tetratricopeptide (TPR) repeat protein
MQRALDSARKARDPIAPVWAVNQSARLARERGRFKEWRSLAEERRQINLSLGRTVRGFAPAMADLQLAALARLPIDSELKALDAALVWYPIEQIPVEERPYIVLAITFALARQPERARAMLARHTSEVKDTALFRLRRPDLDRAEAEITYAEGRWLESVAAARRSDRLPDGPNGICSYCLSFGVAWTFSEAGMADSALAEYEAYRATPFGAIKRVGPDLELGAELYERIAKMYDVKGDTAKAISHYRDFIELWKDADPELQPRVAAARERVSLLSRADQP